MADIDTEVVKQVEYYFGDINLPKDRFLQEEIRMNGDGWVRFSELMKFNRLKRLCGDDSKVMNILATKSALLEVDTNERRVRRRPERALPRDKVAFARELLPRSVYVKGFRRDATLDDIQAYFLRCGTEPEAIRMRRRRDPAAKGGPKRASLEDDDDDEDEAEAAEAAAAAEADTKPKEAAAAAGTGTEAAAISATGRCSFKGSVFTVFRTTGDAERFLKAAQASSDEKADAALFDAAVPFEKKSKGEYFREKKMATKEKRRAVQNAYETVKKGKAGDAARQSKDGESGAPAPVERPFERGMLLRITDVPQALLDFNELKKLFSVADVDIFADLVPASSAAVVRIKRAPIGMTVPEGDAAAKLVASVIWNKLCTKFGSAQPSDAAKPAESDDAKHAVVDASNAAAAATTETASGSKLPVLTYKGSQLHAEVIFGEEEDRFWKDLFAKWEAGSANKPQRKGGKSKQMGKRGKRNWNDKGKRNGKKRHADEDGDDSGSHNERHRKRVRGGGDDDE